MQKYIFSKYNKVMIKVFLKLFLYNAINSKENSNEINKR